MPFSIPEIIILMRKKKSADHWAVEEFRYRNHIILKGEYL